jgi:hypothetical protein
MKNFKRIYILLLGCVLATTFSCTNLDEEVYSDLTGDTFFDTEENLLRAFGTSYTILYQYGAQYSMPSLDVSTDLFAVPTRGGDWLDGGRWQRLHRHEWTTNEIYVDNMWGFIFNGVNICNQLIFQFELSGGDLADNAIAELRALRAFYYWWGVDLFGNIPIETEFDVPDGYLPTPNTRQEVYDFIEAELLEVAPLLTEEVGAVTYGRMTKYAALTTLAKLYLNAEVYTGTAQWQKADDVLNQIIDANKYDLAPSYFDNFKVDASGSPEAILAVPYDDVFATGLTLHYFSLHYQHQEKFSLQATPWNGICALEEFYNSFEDDDDRRNGLLAGPQYGPDGVTQLTDPLYEPFDPTNPAGAFDTDGPGLNLTPAINELEPRALRQAGARLGKFEIEEGIDADNSADYPIFRYAEILQMKAETQWRLNQPDAVDYLNLVRDRANLDPLMTINEDVILAEKAKELYIEGQRRTDLIRFGKYGDAWWEKEMTDINCVSLWPIPQGQIDANPNLVQNPCY